MIDIIVPRGIPPGSKQPFYLNLSDNLIYKASPAGYSYTYRAPNFGELGSRLEVRPRCDYQSSIIKVKLKLDIQRGIRSPIKADY